MSGLLALLLAGCVFLDALIILGSYIYSRFIFSGYLKRHHREKWEKLIYTAEYSGLNWRAFDKTPMMSKFRTESTEDFGDPKIQQIRKTSIYLFKIGMWGWIVILTIFIVMAVIVKIRE